MHFSGSYGTKETVNVSMETDASRPRFIKSTSVTKVHIVLQTFYQTVLSLEEWIRKNDTEGHLQSSLVTEGDQKGYKHLLETTLVAVKASSKRLTAPFNFSQDSHQHELITRCVQRVLHRDGAGNNVLSFGFGPRTDNPKASVSTILDIEYRYPNSSVSRLQYKVWKTLLSRIGDTLMCHLLENTSVFILLVKPAVYLQITGEPVYQLWPYSSSLHWITKEHFPQSQKTTHSKAWGKQNKAEGPSKKQTEKKDKASRKSLSWVPSVEMDKSTSSISTFKPSSTSRKRKRHDDTYGECHKKQKLANYDNSSKSSPQLSTNDMSLTAVPETSRSSAGNVSADKVDSMEIVCGAEECDLSKAASKSKRQKKRLRQKRKQQKVKPCTPGTKAFQHHLYVPRLYLLYGKYLREKFPANFSPARFSPSEDGAKLLLTDIFIQGSVGRNMFRYGQQCQCQATESFPENRKEENGRSSECCRSCSANVSSSVTPRHCDQKKTEQDRSLSDRSCTVSDNVVVRTVQHSGMGQRTESQDDCNTKRQLCRPDDLESKAHSSEDNRSTQISLEESKSIQMSGSKNTARSSIDIEPVESPSLSQVSSMTSSSAAHISNPSSDMESFIGPHPVINHSSSCVNGSSKERTSEQFNAAIYTPEELSLKNINQEGSVHTSCKSADEEMQLYSKETLPGSKDTTLKVLMGASHDEHLQKETEGTTAQKEVKGVPLENSAAPVFQKKVLSLLHDFLQKHRKCKYWAMLNHHCPSRTGQKKSCRKTAASGLQKERQSAGGPGHGKQGYRIRPKRIDKNAATAKLLEDYLPPQKVFAFFRAVVKQIVPVQLIGSSANMAVFLKNVRTLVSSGKFEKMCLGQLMKGMKVKGCEWLRDVACQMEKEHRMAQLVWWLVVSFILPVIRTFFYVTDTTTYRNRLFYYRKTTWLRLKTRALQEFRKATSLKTISKLQVDEWLASGQSLGVSVLRFLPKARSLRPIVNMSAKPKEQKKSINKQLNKLFQVLTSEKALDGSMCGCSVFGLDDIHHKLKQYKEKRTTQHDTRMLYFVKSDISNCFDSIQQHQLYQFVKDILEKSKEQTFMTRKFATVHLAGKRVKRTFHHDTTRLSHYQPDFVSFLRQKYSCGRWNDIIVVDTAFYHEENTASLLQILSSHLFSNIIKVGGRYFLQTTGISQGSVMSTLLASVYLARLEDTHLGVLEDELLIRRMDDYLFITPEKMNAERFVHAMVNGFPDFNCFASVEKILTNFPVAHPSVGAVKHIEQEGVFPWCGLMINTSSLELSVDYSRYSGLSITDTSTFDTSHRAGHTLSHKLLTCLKIKCHAIFFDLEVNSRERILLSVYQALLFVALTFHSFVTKLPPSQRLQSNPRFFVNIVREIPTYMQNLVARNLKQAMCKHQYPVPLLMLQWLTADAFLVRLHQYPGYRALKKFLRASKAAAQRKMDQKDLCALREIHQTAMQMDSTVVLFRRAR